MMNFKFKDLDRIFKIQEVQDDKVIIQVNAGDDPLTVAQYPFIELRYAFITVTRGNSHIMTVIYWDGTTKSYEWSYHHLIDNMITEMLKQAVTKYMHDNGILFEYKPAAGREIMKIDIFHSRKDSHDWALRLLSNDESEEVQDRIVNYYGFFNTGSASADEMIRECGKWVTAEWEMQPDNAGQKEFDIHTARDFKTDIR